MSEALPSLATPQAGSIAALGSVGEGLWVSTAAIKGLVFVDGQERHLGYREGTPELVPITWDGAWQFSGSSWVFAPNGWIGSEHAVRITFPLKGNGTIIPRKAFTGVFGSDDRLNYNMAYEYSIANALAVAPGDLVGSWSSANQKLTVASDGTVVGRIVNASMGSCVVAGNIAAASPGTAKNAFVMMLTGTASTNNYCRMEGQTAQSFKVAITFSNTSQNGVPFYRRSLTFFGVLIGGWSVGELVKE